MNISDLGKGSWQLGDLLIAFQAGDRAWEGECQRPAQYILGLHGGSDRGVCGGRTADTLIGYGLAWHGMEVVHEGLRECSQSLVGSNLGAQ